MDGKWLKFSLSFFDYDKLKNHRVKTIILEQVSSGANFTFLFQSAFVFKTGNLRMKQEDVERVSCQTDL